MKKINIKKLIFKYLFLWIFIISVVIWDSDLYLNYLKDFYTDPANLAAVASIDGTLIGFLITAFTIFMGIINKDTGFVKRAKKYTYDRIFAKTIITGTLAFILSIIFWMFQKEPFLFNRLCVYTFITGIIETGLSLFYLFVFIIYGDNS